MIGDIAETCPSRPLLADSHAGAIARGDLTPRGMSATVCQPNRRSVRHSVAPKRPTASAYTSRADAACRKFAEVARRC
jgi:hypothetical protein